MTRPCYSCRWFSSALTIATISFCILVINLQVSPIQTAEVAVVTTVASNKAQTEKPKTACKSDSDCSKIVNSVCSESQCICKLGFKSETPANGTEQCNPIQCKAAQDCASFGEATKCDNSQCICAKPNHVDRLAQKCVDFLKIKNNCTSASQCGDNFRCSSEHKCECNFGLKLESTECKPFQCTDTKSCTDLFKNNAECITAKDGKKECACKMPFQLDKRSQRCKIQIKNAKAKCSSNEECGDNTQCVKGQCKCLLGSLEDASNFHCEQFSCNAHSECHSKFVNETMCRKQSRTCECFPPTLFKLDPATQSCVEVSKKDCTVTTTDKNAKCIDGILQCQLGFAPNHEASGKCEKFQCDYYKDECEDVFPHGKCTNEEKDPSCACKPQFKFDDKTGGCIKEDNLYLVYGVLGVVGVIFAGPILFFSLKRMMCGSL